MKKLVLFSAILLGSVGIAAAQGAKRPKTQKANAEMKKAEADKASEAKQVALKKADYANRFNTKLEKATPAPAAKKN